MMYSRMKIQPPFMPSGNSVGYVIEREDYREHYNEGDELLFNLILFGSNIVYFSQYLDAYYSLGMKGIGQDEVRFVISSVTNTVGESILKGSNIMMERYRVCTLGDYVEYRMKSIRKGQYLTNCIKIQSPLSLKYSRE